MNKVNWVWMPHAGHFVCGNECRFRLNTYVGGYIVSTVGEYLPDSAVREILGDLRKLNLEGRGDDRQADFLRKNGFEKIGCDRTYETMVFKARRSKNKCCPWEVSGSELDYAPYNDADSAYEGHLKLCQKWSRK